MALARIGAWLATSESRYDVVEGGEEEPGVRAIRGGREEKK